MQQHDRLKTEEAITFIKETFSKTIAKKLNLLKVSSPLVVLDGTGINDDLNGIERPVLFPIKGLEERKAVVVHSLAKWKRVRLKEFGIEPGKGILTDMRALRPDEDFSPLHSVYVDQWDWEKHMRLEDKSLAYLKATVGEIYDSMREVELEVERVYPTIKAVMPDKIKFVHAEELLAQYPLLSAKQREHELAKEFGAVFIIGIGGKLSNGEPHDGRAADYDDWSTKNELGHMGLNGDIILWHPVLKCAFEVSSMGIRVDKVALLRQLKLSKQEDRAELWFHKMLLSDQLPQSIGGGIGQSRVCMFMLKKKHIGEVQVGIWPEKDRAEMQLEGLELL